MATLNLYLQRDYGWIETVSFLINFFKAKKKYVVFPVTPIFNPNFWPDPKVFIQIFLFLIKSCIILFVCQTRLGSLGVLYELYTTTCYKLL